MQIATVEPEGRPIAHVRCACELLAVFGIGFALMSYLYTGGMTPEDTEIGAPGNDSFYHVRMAALISDVGLINRFPWLEFSWFTSDDRFVSHHYGFHVLLNAFVRAARWLGGDELAAGRWAICACFGLTMVLFDLVLIAGGVRWRALWIALFLLLPHQFFLRHAYIRAIGPALTLMLAVVWCLFRKRHIATAFAVLVFTHLYLGGVLYAPVIVGAYVCARLFGPSEERRGALWPAVAGAAGWWLGVLTHPYSHGMWEFLRLQVFGTGLTPDIEVGREWRPFSDTWWFAGDLAGVLLAVWTMAVVLRLRRGPALDARATTLMLLHFGFLVLTLKARRFIEFWPAFCLLSAAYAVNPVLAALSQRVHAFAVSASYRRIVTRLLVVVCGLAVAAATCAGVVNGYVSTPLATPFLVMLALVLLIAWMGDGATLDPTAPAPLHGAGARFWSGIVLVGAVVWLGGADFREVARSLRCRYDLPAIREMMDVLERDSQPGDVVFTDDWDVFPVYFYHNTYNHYVVGLDPKFTHDRRPDLWERYVRITRGQTPQTSKVSWTASDHSRTERIDIRLEDIRDEFGAHYVIVDRDHARLAAQLNRVPEFAERIWPAPTSTNKTPAYTLYRIREGIATPRSVRIAAGPIMYLGSLSPRSVGPDTAEWLADRTLEGGEIRIGNRVHLRGVSMSAPAALQYEVPPGFDRFEASVGVPETGGPALQVSVGVDGRVVYSSTVSPVVDEFRTVSVPLCGGEILTLVVEAIDECWSAGQVLWASARFVRADAE